MVSSVAIRNPKFEIEFLVGDITRETTDAIVNAANSSLLGGGGVDGAIHRAGGTAILAECQKLRATTLKQGLPAGHAVATSAGDLPTRYVIHTVGPIWHGGNSGEPETLASAYRESLRIAEELKLSSVSFPSISTGAYGYPVGQAAEIAVRSVADALNKTHFVRKVRFVLFDSRTFQAYTNAAQQLGYATSAT